MTNLEEPVLGVRVGTILECLEGLLDTFAKKDVEALSDKAVRLQTDDGILCQEHLHIEAPYR